MKKQLNTIIPSIEMAQNTIKINLDLPQTWSDLNEDQLNYILQLRASSTMTAYEIRIAALLRFAGLEQRAPRTDAEKELAEKEGIRFMRVAKIVGSTEKELPMPDWFFLDALNRLSWLDSPTSDVTRLEHLVKDYMPYDAELADVPFGIYLQVDKTWQRAMAWTGVLRDTEADEKSRQTANAVMEECFDEIARLLYQPVKKWYKREPKPLKPDAVMRQNILHWMVGWHAYAALQFPHLFKGGGEGKTVITDEFLKNQIDTQLSALTGGDVTKLPIILEKTLAHDALHILDIKAKEAAEAKKLQEEAMAKAKRR